MTTQKPHRSPLRIAAPYYGSFNHPSGGQGNIFLVMDIDLAVSRVANMDIKVWNPKNGCRLGSWLQQVGIETFFCRDIDSCHQQELLGSGIHIEALGGCDILAGIRTWLANAGSQLINHAGPLPA